MNKKLILIVFLWFSGVIPSSIYGQIYISKPNSVNLPITYEEIQSIYNSLQNHYQKEVIKDMALASVIASLNMIPSTSVNLEKFTLGANLTSAFTKERKVDVIVPSYGIIQDVPSMGFSSIPNLFIGFNLGFLFSGSKKTDQIPFFSLYRFDLYLAALDTKINSKKYNEYKNYIINKNNDFQYWEIASKTRGIEIRYHLVESSKNSSILFKFLGASLGTGLYSSDQNIQYTTTSRELNLISEKEINIKSPGFSNNDVSNHASLYFFDIKTGFQIFYIFRISAGIGNAWIQGNTRMMINRFAILTQSPVEIFLFNGTFSNDPAIRALSLSLRNQYSSPQTYMLNMFFYASGRPKYKAYAYYSAGLEINIPILKIFVNIKGINENEVSSTSFGIRFDF